MGKRCIGIDIGSSYLHAVQISRTDEHLTIEKILSSQTRRTTDSPSDILKTLHTSHGFDKRADVAISMPPDSVFFRNLQTVSLTAAKKKIIDQADLENNFPLPQDDIVALPCSRPNLYAQSPCVLTTAASKGSLQKRRRLMDDANINTAIIDTDIFAVHSAIQLNHPESEIGPAAIIHICQSHIVIAFTRNNNILFVRNLPLLSSHDSSSDSAVEQMIEMFTHEISITWKKVFSNNFENDSRIYLTATENAPADLISGVKEKLNCRVVTVDPFARVTKPAEYNANPAISLAEGLALRALAPDKTAGVNFLNADRKNILAGLNLKKEFRIYAALVSSIAVVFLAGIFIQLAYLESKNSFINNEVKDIFERTIPEEKNIVNPLAQMEQNLIAMQKKYNIFRNSSDSASVPQPLFHAITKSVPSQVNITIDSLLITAVSVRITGTSESFAAVYDWQKLLQYLPQFSSVNVTDTNRDRNDGLVHFTISAQLFTSEQK